MESTDAVGLGDYCIKAKMATASADGGLISARLLAVMCGVGAGLLVADASAGGQPSSMSPSTECVSPSTLISSVIFVLRFSSL
jgi:uncharacterized membrane protein YeiH